MALKVVNTVYYIFFNNSTKKDVTRKLDETSTIDSKK